jgi:hydroxymethylpyrimidine pyrophosphatase-like HAD family hydrolase
MKIAVDFDGTIVEHRYPEIGKTMLFAFETLKELQKQQHELVLWTYRAGKELDEAVEFCRKNGIEFYAVNKNYPEEEFDIETVSRKINADIYIDDRNVGGFLGWSKIWQLLNDNQLGDAQQEMKFVKEQIGQESIWKRIFGKI